MKKSIAILSLLLAASFALHAQVLSTKELVEKGIAQNDKGEYGAALTYYHQALALDSNCEQALYELGFTLLSLKRYDEAFKYACKVIAINKKYVDDAYVLKGNVLDMQDRGDEALEVYLTAIRKYPDNFMLHYNTSLVYFSRKQYNSAAVEAEQSLRINPMHPGSNLILAYAMYFQGRRVQSLLSLYFFLMLENNTQRASTAFGLLQNQLAQGVAKDSTQVNITISNKKDDEFTSADMLISLTTALQINQTDKPAMELLDTVTASLFSLLDEENAKRKGGEDIWWSVYIPFFGRMNEQKFTNTFCYYIAAAGNDQAVTKWLNENKTKKEEFLAYVSQSLSRE